MTEVRKRTMKLTLRKKLGLAFGVILALMMISAVVTYVKLAAIQQVQNQILQVRVPSLETARNLQRDLNQTQSKGRQAILAGSESDRKDAAKKLFDTAWDGIEKDIARLGELSPAWVHQENRDRLVTIKKELPHLREVQEVAMNHAASGEKDAVVKAGNEFADKATTAAEPIKQSLDGLADSLGTVLKENQETLKAANTSLNLAIAVTTAVALAVGIFVAIFLSRRISGTAQSILRHAEAIAAGDLTMEALPVLSEDELGDLTTAINKMSASLKATILVISENVEKVAAAGEELSATSQQITANSEETTAQAKVVADAGTQVNSSLQTLASGSEEMNATIGEIAKNATEE